MGGVSPDLDICNIAGGRQPLASRKYYIGGGLEGQVVIGVDQTILFLEFPPPPPTPSAMPYQQFQGLSSILPYWYGYIEVDDG